MTQNLSTATPSHSAIPSITPARSVFDKSPSHTPDQNTDENQYASAKVLNTIGDHPVGCGGNSDVWKAEATMCDTVIVVAVKVLRSPGSDLAALCKMLEREVRCWKHLDHKNIAPFHGVHYQSNGVPAVLLPWYENGSANVYLREHPKASPIHLIKGIADGLTYLHDKGIIHGDIKGSNIMVDDRGRARLIDFGLARLTDSASLTTPTSSLRWSAPELLSPDSECITTTRASDVYAFGNTALELLTGQIPYSQLNGRCVLLVVMSGTSPRGFTGAFRADLGLPLAVELALWDLLDRCWEEASERPGIRTARQCLDVDLSSGL
ncbi:kinase-like protein [Ramaria rubella]|nr:kinase-like protein [Ramaria rubella]